MALKYFFRAAFDDSTAIVQDPEDISSLDPKRSSFFDVCAKEQESKLINFSLWNYDGTCSYAVNLLDGSFQVNGCPFRFHESRVPLHDFRLVFFRRHKHTLNSEYEELNHTIIYRMGWQANDAEGKNVQEVMEID